jgi:2-polyprenyl-3-methyl-5-hydroxy-6-metoxy-1,4-benzoquinol methylase
MLWSNMYLRFKAAIKPHGKEAFLLNLSKKALIVDIGCGGNLDRTFKYLLPECTYTGVDVCPPQPGSNADRFIIASPEGFAEEIAKLKEAFDAVISSHNIEHCNDRQAAFSAVADAVKPGGLLYMSFPSGNTVAFPSRKGTLNYV